MKKIYNYILPVLFTVFAASCDGDDEEVIRMQNQDPVVTVTSVSDAVGYVGNEFTIYGTNFGIIANDVEVFVGNTKLQLISCEERTDRKSSGGYHCRAYLRSSLRATCRYAIDVRRTRGSGY